MQYFFILGNNPALSTAEISAIFPNNKLILASFEILLMNSPEPIDTANLMRKLGGTIKIGEIIDNLGVPGAGDTKETVGNILEKSARELGDHKFNFGFSFYGKGYLNLKNLGLEIKKDLKSQGLSARFVVSREKNLSSVIVEQNNLLTHGQEIIFIEYNGELLIGKTLAVQLFKELSFRDFGRPARDDLSGMLPPKLAQVMINFADAKSEAVILDPFCGSGTLLTEAILAGYQNILGSDISEKAIIDTKKNVGWIKEKFTKFKSDIKVSQVSAINLSQEIQLNSVDAIITEPYLGPQRGKRDEQGIINELTKLYSDSIKEFYKILKPGGKVVMVWPIFIFYRQSQKTLSYLNPNIGNFKKINILNSKLQTRFNLDPKHPLIYGRPHQKVWREIVVLEK